MTEHRKNIFERNPKKTLALLCLGDPMPFPGISKKAFHLALILENLLRLALARRASAEPGRADRSVSPKRILFAAYSAIGDFIYLLPTLRALRQAFPEARLVCMGDSYLPTAELLRAAGLADEIWTIEAPYGYRQAPAAVLARIREGGFDAVVLNLPTSARFFGSSLLSIPLRIGHLRPLAAPHEGWSALRYALWRLRRGVILEEFERRIIVNAPVWLTDPREHMAAANLRLLSPLGVSVPPAVEARPPLPSSSRGAALAEREIGASPGEKILGLHIGSPDSLYGKVWAPERWGEVCRRLHEAYAVRVVLLGGSQEAPVARRFGAAFGASFTDLVGRCGMVETIDVIRRCDLFLGDDTGLVKAAMALGVPTATVWGPSDRPGYGVLWEPEKHLEIFYPVPCAPCVRMGPPNEGSGVLNFLTCGHHACMNELSPDEVFSAVRSRYGGLLGPR